MNLTLEKNINQLQIQTTFFRLASVSQKLFAHLVMFPDTGATIPVRFGSSPPRRSVLSPLDDLHNFFTDANQRLSFSQVRSICVNGSIDYGRFVANRFE
ncbi:hypothetical protein Pfl01_4563 [Pseudomonas fluorescens Pf0-1]|uniref:Uncharacterized protein n=1 Tax=Pseudomonas fluorescens (strain Pf0-1) TaxID=205922 RepID=Q3K7F4_PSEPF|nr:hypothetical protein Pfl01_4563 [Pseudomonas fluorescens Pf0-1]